MLVKRSLSGSVDVDPALAPELVVQGRALFDKFYGESHEQSTAYEGVASTLAALHGAGVLLAVLTNKPDIFVRPILQQHGIEQYFVDIIGADTFEGHRKPDPHALLWLMEKHSLQPSELVMVGDSRNDILAAKAAGCLSVGVTYGYNYGLPIADSEPDRVLSQFSKLCWVVAAIDSLWLECAAEPEEAAWLEDNTAWPVSGPPSEEYQQEQATEAQMPSEDAETDLDAALDEAERVERIATKRHLAAVDCAKKEARAAAKAAKEEAAAAAAAEEGAVGEEDEHMDRLMAEMKGAMADSRNVIAGMTSSSEENK